MAMSSAYLGAVALARLAVIRTWKLWRERVQPRKARAAQSSGPRLGITLLARRHEILATVRTIQNYVTDAKESQGKVPGAEHTPSNCANISTPWARPAWVAYLLAARRQQPTRVSAITVCDINGNRRLEKPDSRGPHL
jgi:hypothetical protein